MNETTREATRPTNRGGNWRDRLQAARMAIQAFLRLYPISGSRNGQIASGARVDRRFEPIAGDTLARFRLIASAIVDSDPVIRTYAACEWEDLGENGKDWIAGIVSEAMRRAEPILAAELRQSRETVMALQQPQIFSVAGMVDRDLAERYRSLQESYETVAGERDAAVEARVSADHRAAELERMVEELRRESGELEIEA